MFLASFCFCLAVHFALERGARLPFATAFKIGRGVASVGMTAIGFYALVRYIALLPRCYVAHQGDDATARALTLVIMGHFVADFVLVGWGQLQRVRPRPDLVIHHALGLFAASMVLRLEAGHALYLGLFTTEMMPVTTAVGALGLAIGRPSWERAAQGLRLAVLLAWRIPLWFVIAYLVWKNLDAGPADAVLRAVYHFSSAFLVITLSLDAFWTYKSWQALRREVATSSSSRSRSLSSLRR